MKPLRVGVVCDLREEGWHSMDLIADMLLDTLPSVAGAEIAATRLCPPMVRRWTRLPIVGSGSRARLGDRLTGRLWDYPRWLAPRRDEFDVFHIVDHSYAHLVRVLPAERTIVTCNDIDAFEAARHGERLAARSRRGCSPRMCSTASHAPRMLRASAKRRGRVCSRPAGSIRARRASCISARIRAASPAPDAKADAEIDRQLGPRGFETAARGSTIPRKRIDVLLEMFSRIPQQSGRTPGWCVSEGR